MKKHIGLVFLFILFLAGCQNQTSQQVQPETKVVAGNPIPSETFGQVETGSSRYVSFSSEAFNSATSTRRVLFFYANWCPTCLPADKEFSEKMSEIPDDVTLIRVNYNDTDTDQSEKDLAKMYGVTYQHTFVYIDENGKEITKWNGGRIEELLKNIK